MKVFCEHPVVILNPAWEVFYRNNQNARIVINGVTKKIGGLINFDKFILMPRRNGVTPDNAENSFVIDTTTGETIPLYMVVPCGKCTICRDKKSREIMARCVAETNRWGTTPLFITFTYNDQNLPSDGVRKSDLQMFFKRLRSRLDYYKIQHELRYFAVAEYGSKYGRPHYHVILWNFPKNDTHFPTIVSVQKFIERCWSRYETDANGDFIPLRDSRNIIRRFPSGRPVYRTSPIGWIKILPVTQGCPAYVTKYMRKAPKVPVGKNPCFSLASNRGGGIGAQWIRSQKDYFCQNPEITALEVTDKVVSGKTFRMPVTTYVKSQFFKNPSSFFSSKDYTVLRRFCNCLDLLENFSARYDMKARQKGWFTLKDELEYRAYYVKTDGRSKLNYHNPRYDMRSYPSLVQAYEKISGILQFTPGRDIRNKMRFLFRKEHFEVYFKDLLNLLLTDAETILGMKDYRQYFCNRKKVMELRTQRLSVLMQNVQQPSVESRVESIIRNVERNEYKETF